MAEPSFTKDFAYLWPFFERLAAHAEETDQAALAAAVTVARRACGQVDALLQGGATTAPPAPVAVAAQSSEDHALAPPKPTDAVTRVGEAWTVGSLFERDARGQ